MATYADPADVAVELGRPSPDQGSAVESQWQQWLERVERSIRRGFTRAGLDLATEITAGRVSVDDVKDVEIARVAARVTAVAPGLSSENVSVDDGQLTRRREDDSTSDLLDLTPADWDVLLPDYANFAAFSIRLVPDPGFADEVARW